MALKEGTGTSVEKKEHCWEEPKEYVLSEDESRLLEMDDALSGELGGICEILKKMEVNQFLPVATLSAKTLDTRPFDRYINILRQKYGFDIGNRECEYGRRMPLPEKKEIYRKLIIFRRRNGE